MGRSRKKTSGGTQSLNDNELRRYVLLLTIPCILLLLVVIVLISGAVRDRADAGGAASPGEIGAGAVEGGVSEGADWQEAESEEETGEELVIEPDTKEYVYDFGGSILSQDAVPEIHELMEQYFASISGCDMATFLHLFTSQDTSEEEAYRQEFEQQSQYMDGYQNISCYTTPGLQDGEYAAYVYYEICYTGVATPAPGLVRIYAVRGEDGQYRIYDEEISPELEAFLEQLSVNEDVRLLSTQVDQKMQEAMEADPALRERVEYMKQGASYMQEE